MCAYRNLSAKSLWLQIVFIMQIQTSQIDGESRRRAAFIEILARWCGRVGAKDLKAAFGLSDATAGRTLADFTAAHPHLLRHHPHERGYHRINSDPGDADANAALLFLRGQSFANRFAPGAGATGRLAVEDADSLTTPPIDSQVLGHFLQATEHRRTLAVRYAGRERTSEMVISPHRLIHALHRYHARCIDHRDDMWKDIVLSRVIRSDLTEIEFINRPDPSWTEHTTLRFSVNPALTAAMRASVANEWKLREHGVHTITCRTALARYVTRRMTMPTTEGPARWVVADADTEKL
jgi:hypothetical protein